MRAVHFSLVILDYLLFPFILIFVLYALFRLLLQSNIILNILYNIWLPLKAKHLVWPGAIEHEDEKSSHSEEETPSTWKSTKVNGWLKQFPFKTRATTRQMCNLSQTIPPIDSSLGNSLQFLHCVGYAVYANKIKKSNKKLATVLRRWN